MSGDLREAIEEAIESVHGPLSMLILDITADAILAMPQMQALLAKDDEIERLRVERDDHKQRLAIEAVTAPDADYDTMMDSLQARLRDLHAEVERLRAMVEPKEHRPQQKCVNDPHRSCVSWITCRMSEECYYDYQVRVSNRSGQPSK